MFGFTKKPIIDYARSRFNFKLCDLRRVEYVTIEETLRECLQRTAKLDYNILEDEDCWLIMFGATIACDHAQRSDDYKADKIESFEFQIHFNNFVENGVFGKIVHGDFFAWSPERLRMAG